MEFAIGFLAGVVANTVFGMVTRLLPPTWVRYHVGVTDVQMMSELVGHVYTASVVIQTPKFRRALMEPLREYLEVYCSLDGRGRQQAKWSEGDVSA